MSNVYFSIFTHIFDERMATPATTFFYSCFVTLVSRARGGGGVAVYFCGVYTLIYRYELVE